MRFLPPTRASPPMSPPSDPSVQDQTWICPSCGAKSSTPFCPPCGERRWNEHDLTIRHLMGQLMESLTHLDSRLFRTLRLLVAQPGKLTLAYLRGARRPYLSPFHIFLDANLVFLLVQLLSGPSLFNTPLAAHLGHQLHGSLAQRLVDHHLGTTGMSLDQYTPIFNYAETIFSRTLILLMLPPFAVIAGLVFVDRRRLAVTHLVFALHLYAFMLIVLCVLFPAVTVVAHLLIHFGVAVDPELLGWIVTALQVAPCVVYLAWSARAVYDVGPLRRWWSAGLLTLATLGILYGYRLTLLVFTLWAT